jgi:hypothetical protein
MRRIALLGTLLALLNPVAVFGSVDSTGPFGINSSGLPLTGMGIDIGQVEPKRPGDPNGVPGFIDAQTMYNSTFDPEGRVLPPKFN